MKIYIDIKQISRMVWHDMDELFTDVIKDVSEDTLIITYCDGETCNLSHDLALFLRHIGFSNVKVLVNGWTVWRENDLNTHKDKGRYVDALCSSANSNLRPTIPISVTGRIQ